MPEWLKGTGCKPVDESLRWFESNSAHLEASLSQDCEASEFEIAVPVLLAINGRYVSID